MNKKMTIERLKELKEECLALYSNGYIKLTLLDDLTALLDGEIARQSVTGEDVQRAIDRLQECVTDAFEAGDGEQTGFVVRLSIIRTCLTALRQMPKEPCEWCNGKWEIDIKYRRKNGGVFSITNFCPNCGRELKGGE